MNLWRSFARSSPPCRLRIAHLRTCGNKRLASTASERSLLHANLVLPLKQNLSNDRPQRALDFFHERMKTSTFSSETRFIAYVRAITIFMIHGHLSSASTIYARMQAEGYIPPRPIQATLSIMRSLAHEKSRESLLRAAEKSFYSEDFDEEDFRAVLRIIFRQTRLSISVYDALLELFIQSRGKEDYTLSEKTLGWLTSIRARRSPPREIIAYPLALLKDGLPRAYDEAREAEFTALRNMAERDPELAPVIYSALQRMEFSGGAHDRIFYNVILSAMEAKQRYADTFALYRMLRNSDIAILPDAFTFGAVRRALVAVSRPRSVHTRRFKKPDDTPSFRELFRDILHSHQQFFAKSAPVVAVNGSLLNKIVSNFMAARDYAAAFVAIRSYSVLDIPITLATYRAVICSLMVRLEAESRELESSEDLNRHWSTRFLGYRMQNVDVRLAESILESGRDPTLHLNSLRTWTAQEAFDHAGAIGAYMSATSSENVNGITYRHIHRGYGGKSGYRIPTGVTLLGMLQCPMDTFSAAPLQRILRRALLAEHPRTFITPSKVISMDIRHAKSQMLPPPMRPPPPKEQK